MNDDSSNDDDDDDDDDYHVPHNWSGYDFSKLSVNEGEAVPWEYRQNEVSIGSVYANSDNMKEAIKYWSTHSLQREFKFVKSSPRTYDVRCVRSECPFRVYASMGKWQDFWEVRKVVEHTCLLEQLEPQHHNLSAGFIANYMYPLIVDNLSYESKSIIRAVEEEFKYKIRYNKTYRAKQKALQMRWGTYEASYHV